MPLIEMCIISWENFSYNARIAVSVVDRGSGSYEAVCSDVLNLHHGQLVTFCN